MGPQDLQDARESLVSASKERKVSLGSQDPGVSLVPMDLQVFPNNYRKSTSRIQTSGMVFSILVNLVVLLRSLDMH